MRTHACALLTCLAFGCSISEAGNIPCYDNSACPSDYPVCQGASPGTPGKCAAVGAGVTPPPSGTVQITQVEGYPSTSAVVRGAVNVDVLAQATSGIQSVSLAVEGVATPLSPSASSNGLYTFSVDTTAAATPTGSLKLTASIVPANGSTPPDPATLSLSYDNQAPTLAVAGLSPVEARPGSLIVLDLTSSEPLASLSGAVTLGGNLVAAMSKSQSGALAYELSWMVPLDAEAGAYSIAVDAADEPGNAAAAGAAVPVQAFNVRRSFTTAVALSAPSLLVGGVPAGKAGAAFTAKLTLPSSVQTAAAPSFTLLDAAGHSRALSGTPASASASGTTTWTLSDAIVAADASGLASIAASIADLSGNSATAGAGLLVDKDAPIASGVAVGKAAVDAIDATETLTATASEAVSAASVTTSNGDSGTCSIASQPAVTCTIVLSAPASATDVTATLRLTDLVGNQNTGSTAAYALVPLPTATSLTTSAAKITAGGTAALLATFASGTGDVNGIGVVSGQPLTVAPAASTTYALTVRNSAGHTAAKSVDVAVIPAPAITTALAASAPRITLGDSVTLTAAFANGTATLDGNAFTGSATLSPGSLGTHTYTLSVSNDATAPAVVSQAVSVEVIAAPAAASLTAAVPAIAAGQSVALTPVFSDGSGAIDNGVGLVSSSGAVLVTPAQTTTYTLTVTNALGATSTRSVTVTVDAAPAISAFTVTSPEFPTPASAIYADSGTTGVAFHFAFSGGTAAIDGSIGAVSGSSAPLGAVPTITTIYTLTVAGTNGSLATAGVTVNVVPALAAGDNLTASLSTITAGRSSTLTVALAAGETATLSGAPVADGQQLQISPAADTTYTLQIANPAGHTQTRSASVAVLAAPSITSFSARAASVTAGHSLTLDFGFSGAVADVGGASVASGTPLTVTAPATAGAATYTLTVKNAASPPPGGTVTAAVTVQVVDAPSADLEFAAVASSCLWDGSGQAIAVDPHCPVVLVATFSGGSAALLGQTYSSSPQTILIDNLDQSTSYTLVTTDAAGDTASSTASATVKAHISSFSVSPAYVTQGVTTTLLFTATQEGGGASGTASGTITPGNLTLTSGVNRTAAVDLTGNTLGDVTYTLSVTNSAGTAVTSSTSATVVAPASAISLTAGTANIDTGTSTTLTPHFSNDAGGTAVVRSGSTSGPIVFSGLSDNTQVTVGPAATTQYFLVVTNRAGQSASASATVNVMDAASFGSGSFAVTSPAGATVTGGTGVATIAFSIPHFGASVTSAILTDDSGAAATDAGGTAITSAAILAAGSGGTALTVKMPVTQATDNGALTYTLTALNAAGSAALAAKLTVVPKPTGVTLSGATTITSGGSATLTAGAFSGGSGVVNPGSIPVTSGGTIQVNPATDTAYTLTVTSPAGDAQGTVSSSALTVAVAQVPTLTGELSLNTNAVTVGDALITATAPTFSGGTFSATVQIFDKNNNGVGSPASIASGGQTVLLVNTLTTGNSPYSVVLIAKNSATTPATLSQSAPLAVYADTGAFLGSPSASPATITDGDTGSITFTTPAWGSNIAYGILTGDNRSVTVSSSAAQVTLAKPTTTTTYTLTPYNAAGKAGVITALNHVTVTVVAAPVITKFSAATNHSTAGDSVTFTIATTGVANGLWTGAIAASGGTGCSGSTDVTLSSGGATPSVTMPGVTGASGQSCAFTLLLQNAATSAASASAAQSITVEPLQSVSVFNLTSATHFAPGGTATLSYTCSNETSGTNTINGVAATCDGSAHTASFTNVQATTTYQLSMTNLAGKVVTSTTRTQTIDATAYSFTAGATQASSTTALNVTNGGTTNLFASYAGAGASGTDSSSTTISCSGTCGTLGSTHISSGGSVGVSGLTTNGAGTYTLSVSASGAPGNNFNTSVTITVLAAATTTSLTASQSSILSGDSLSLTAVYKTDSAGSATISDGANTWTLPAADETGGTSISVAPSSSVTYTLTVKNGAGTTATLRTAAVTVTAAPTISTFTLNSALSGTSNSVVHATYQATITFACSYTSSGNTATLTGLNAAGTVFTINSLPGDGSCTGVTATPSSTTNYTLTVTNTATGVSRSRSLQAIVDPSIASITVTNFGSTGSSVLAGINDNPTLTFTFYNGHGQITVSGGTDSGTPYDAGTATDNAIIGGGTKQVQPATAGTLTYTLTVSGTAGNNNTTSTAATATVTVTVEPGSWAALAGGSITARYGATVTRINNSKVLIAGGCDDAACTNAPFNTAVICNNSGSCAAPAGSCGGVSSSFTMLKKHAYGAAVKLNNGIILITGGYTGVGKTTVTAGTEQYDPAADCFLKATDNMTTARAEHTTTLLDVSGGNEVINAGGIIDDTGTLTNATDSFQSLGFTNTTGNTMGTARAQHTATQLSGGTMLVVGGSGDTSTRICTYSTSTHKCTWSAGGTLGEAKSHHSAVLLTSGNNANRVLVCGGLVGSNPSQKCYLTSTTGTGAATAVTNLVTARYGFAGIEIPTSAGKALFCGGIVAGGGQTDSCEVQVATGTAGTTTDIPTMSMINPRAFFGLTTFATSSEVLAAGGDASSNLVEVYTP